MTTPRRLLRALGALFGLGALVGALPALLVTLVGWPLPRSLPTPDQISTALGDGWRPDERFVMGLLALLLWLVWVQVLRHLFVQVRLHRLQAAAVASGADPARRQWWRPPAAGAARCSASWAGWWEG
ncbi:MAG: hypothetical protein ACLGIO_00965 [Acidimicrobiia bacterium]